MQKLSHLLHGSQFNLVVTTCFAYACAYGSSQESCNKVIFVAIPSCPAGPDWMLHKSIVIKTLYWSLDGKSDTDAVASLRAVASNGEPVLGATARLGAGPNMHLTIRTAQAGENSCSVEIFFRGQKTVRMRRQHHAHGPLRSQPCRPQPNAARCRDGQADPKPRPSMRSRCRLMLRQHGRHGAPAFRRWRTGRLHCSGRRLRRVEAARSGD